MKRTLLLSLVIFSGLALLWAAPHAGQSAAPRHQMREIPDTQKFTIANETEGAPDKKGWYYHVLNVADTPDGLLCVYRKTDAHTALMSDIMAARSTDGGRTWKEHKLISHSDVWNEGGLWVAPQLTRLRDGRLVIIADFGRRTTGQNWPMLSQWQKADRGMSNHLFWSRDNGKTWEGPTKIDDVGGEPGYILELSDGTLVYPRTPDQFRRDRIVRVDRNGSFSPGNSGYSGWTQMRDGSVVIADYTNGYPAARIPFARAYVTTEEFLVGKEQ